jgi:signal transduction histidine kinase
VEEQSAAEQAALAHRQLMHDLRTPLTVLLARVQMLRRCHAAGRRSEDVGSDLEVIEAAVLRLAAAVDQADRRGPVDP